MELKVTIREETRNNNTRRKFRQLARDVCREVFDIPEDNRVLFAYATLHNKETVVGELSFQPADEVLREPGRLFDSEYYNQVTFLFVKADFQGNGIGKQLLQKAIMTMKTHSQRAIRVQSAERAVKFFEKNEFVVKGEPTESMCGVRLFRYIYNMELMK